MHREKPSHVPRQSEGGAEEEEAFSPDGADRSAAFAAAIGCIPEVHDGSVVLFLCVPAQARVLGFVQRLRDCHDYEYLCVSLTPTDPGDIVCPQYFVDRHVTATSL
jgi:hypothetical protein